MLELGKHSIKQHRLISKIINKTNLIKRDFYDKNIEKMSGFTVE